MGRTVLGKLHPAIQVIKIDFLSTQREWLLERIVTKDKSLNLIYVNLLEVMMQNRFTDVRQVVEREFTQRGYIMKTKHNA